MTSPVVKRSIVIAGHKTSVSLEDAFWKGLKAIAVSRRATLSELVAAIDSQRREGNLSSAIRLFVLQHVQAAAADSGLAGPDDMRRGADNGVAVGRGRDQNAKSERADGLHALGRVAAAAQRSPAQ